MKAITIQQPWAWAVIFGGKSVENRTRIGTWRPAVGERIAIHAGLRWSDRGADFLPLQQAYAEWLGFTHWAGQYGGHTAMPIDPHSDDRDRELIDFGAIIGTVQVVDVHLAEGEVHAFDDYYAAACCESVWGEHSYIERGGTKRVDVVHLVLDDPQPCTPIRQRGALGLWTVPPRVVDEIAVATADWNRSQLTEEAR